MLLYLDLGYDAAKREHLGPTREQLAGPMMGRICTSIILELLVYPAIYAVWRERALEQEPTQGKFIAASHLDTTYAIGADTTL